MNTHTDNHRYLISAPWGDTAYADTIDAARAAKHQLGQDRRDSGTYDARTDDVTIVDRGPTADDVHRAITEAAARDRDAARRFAAFAARVDERTLVLGLSGDDLGRYVDTALLVFRASRREES